MLYAVESLLGMLFFCPTLIELRILNCPSAPMRLLAAAALSEMWPNG
jgi:hypothetical protein